MAVATFTMLMMVHATRGFVARPPVLVLRARGGVEQVAPPVAASPVPRPRAAPAAAAREAAATAAASAVLDTACGAVGAACFALILAPQALLNHRRRSTDGLSLSLVVLWHLGSLIYGGALVVSGASAWLLASMASFCAMSAVLEAQVAVYARKASAPLAVVAAALTLASGLCIWLLARALAAAPTAVLALFGHVLPAAFFGVGFLPQLRVFVGTWEVEGYSFGVTALDVLGCAANTVVLARAGSLWPDALPLLTIISLHLVLLALAGWIKVTPRTGRKRGGDGGGSGAVGPAASAA